ncbi:UDP-N-acetylglucosamine--N-acetylmuramyl-(pentapeptide) pyrophosphoryl-undecaprenol N-acetylglucosamine transferase [Aneurinibacillus sp. Ricciae_BoGa-3]|uniref:UDP-N-acetylglucosamine--N-acetylmuramyl- (pentapeptide) pyrophosphoryl-undecaprenol N-acetylglucosamine transferase n=1 Tax=Aneurinibacillus sp. Ricciae_BoGa-3 TaxID=3022697 RepID=UPI0023401A2C|nr:UDP-N-acetylglucosamine--N-acetylmuramyl-(pentapeptide) pyrophosphoryl-undecaprenol N-acetylglucosamine transferase [Aneurinibacillus sp. Ricciae_BoGa-3]WCK55800.1 UDP-N-acetylglucosamine--N-acetylmuramyl-(pentapeptide) pyrophosphoryl-undecaprenol N-acetylglucosamine transferase [Aneurinibacillus sp. Ricciae_BoGa-3]
MKIVITGGGTAGHIFPAISVGKYLQEQHGAELFFIGNKNHIESRLAKENNIPFFGIPSQGLEGNYFTFFTKNAMGVCEALNILRKIKPDYVFSTGGFVSAPTITAANILRIPYGIHEQNSIIGKVNKLFQRNARTFFYSFPAEQRENTCYSGNPVRLKDKLAVNGAKLLFTGGSGGSIKLNQTAVEFAKQHPDIPCILISGQKNYKQLVEQGIPANLEVLPFVSDMKSLYAQAKVMVCRSGSGTLFEMANLSIPSILVPLPTSADDHQKKNALYFAKENAALLVEQKDYFEEKLTGAILELWNNETKRNEIQQALAQLAIPESEKVIAHRILKDIGYSSI